MVVLLGYRLAKPEQELVLRRGPFMASERLGVVSAKCAHRGEFEGGGGAMLWWLSSFQDDDGGAPSFFDSGSGRAPAAAAASFSAPLLLLSSLGLVCWCEPHGGGEAW